MIDAESRWAKLLLTVSEGNAGTATHLSRLDSSEFYYLYEAWISRQEMISQAHKNAAKPTK